MAKKAKNTLTGGIAGLILFISSFSNANPLWQGEIYVTWSGISQRLVFGMAEDATNGYDPAYESIAYFWGGEPFKSYFYHPGWNGTSDYFWSDLRSPSNLAQWHFYVEAKRDGLIELTWTLTPLPQNVSYLTLTIISNTSSWTVDMKSEPSYSFYAVRGEKYHFIVRYKRATRFNPPSIVSALVDEESVTLKVNFDHSRVRLMKIYRIVIPVSESREEKEMIKSAKKVRSSPEAVIIFKGKLTGNHIQDRLSAKAREALRKGTGTIYYRIIATSTDGQMAVSADFPLNKNYIVAQAR